MKTPSGAFRTAVLLVGVLVAAPLSAQPTTYTYTGDAYTSADPPYALGGSLSGSFELATPLPGFLPLSDLTGLLVDFSFNDGVETRTMASSFVCAFEVATDGAGNVTQWQILLRRSPYNPGDPHHSVGTSGQPGVIQGIDTVGTGTAPPDPCDAMVLTTTAVAATQGSWVSDQPLPSQPTTYTYTGDAYTTADPPYAVGGTLTGTLQLANPLPAFLPLSDLLPAIAGFSFDDGVETRTLASSFVCAFEVATDGAGNITQWAIRLRRFPYNPGDPHHSIETSGQPGVIQGADLVGTGTAPPDPCDPMVLTTTAVASTQGSWVSSQPLPSQPRTYIYTGDPYTTAEAPYALGGHLTGTLTIANPLPAFLPLSDLRPAVSDLSFDDGVEIRTLAGSFLCRFEVATDGTGNIVEWDIRLARSPYNPGDPQHVVESSGIAGLPEGADFVGTGINPAGPCDPMLLSPTAFAASEGTWSTQGGPSAVEVPALGSLGLLALALALAVATLWVIARGSQAS